MNGQTVYVPSQLAQLGVKPDPDVRTVTLTIGGNDVGGGLKNVIQACIFSTFSCQTEYGSAAEDAIYDWEHPGSSDSPAFVETLNAILERAPYADVWVVGYPHLFTSDPARYPGGECHVGYGLTISRDEALWLNSLVDRYYQSMFNSFAQSTDSDRLHLIDLRDLYSNNSSYTGSHELCGEGDDWINGITANPGGFKAFALDSFHPNETGYSRTAKHVDSTVGG